MQAVTGDCEYTSPYQCNIYKKSEGDYIFHLTHVVFFVETGWVFTPVHIYLCRNFSQWLGGGGGERLPRGGHLPRTLRYMQTIPSGLLQSTLSNNIAFMSIQYAKAGSYPNTSVHINIWMCVRFDGLLLRAPNRRCSVRYMRYVMVYAHSAPWVHPRHVMTTDRIVQTLDGKATTSGKRRMEPATQ